MPSDNILLEIRADIKDIKNKLATVKGQFKGTSKEVTKQTKKMNEGFSKMGNLVKAAFSVAVVYKFMQAMKGTITAAIKQEKAIMGLRSIMLNLKTATKAEIEALILYSEELQKVTVYGDEELQAAMAMLGTFRLTASQIKETVPRLMDFSAAIEMMTGRQMALADVATLIGKALIGQTGMLSRYGVVVDKEAIKVDAFSGVLKSLDDNFKGQAKTLSETTEGPLRQFGNAMGDLKEEIGEIVIPALEGITKALKPVVEWMGKFVNKVDEIIERDEKQKGLREETMQKWVAQQIKYYNTLLEQEKKAAEYVASPRHMKKIEEYTEHIEWLTEKLKKLESAGKDIRYEDEKRIEIKEEEAETDKRRFEQMLARIHEEYEARKKLREEIERAHSEQFAQFKGMVEDTETLTNEALESLQDVNKKTFDVFGNVAETALDSVSGYFLDTFVLARGEMNRFGSDWKSFIDQLIADLIRSTFKMGLMKVFSSAIGMISGAGGGLPIPGGGDIAVAGGGSPLMKASSPKGKRYLEESMKQQLNVESITAWELG